MDKGIGDKDFLFKVKALRKDELMKVYALVGGSGTGKSYRALQIAYEKDINYIIDDGILIYKKKILCGVSAKQADTKIEAVKRAIFHDLNHRNEVAKYIKDESIDKILIIGTSNKMVNQISNKLELGNIYKTIYIEDIATKEEINIALNSRKQGNHIIPVPAIEIKGRVNGLSVNPIKLLFKNKQKQEKEVEKTIIRPTFSYIGRFYISKDVIKQIITYELNQMDEVRNINYIKINYDDMYLKIDLDINLRYCEITRTCLKIQKKIMKYIYNITLINVKKVNIYVNKISKC